MLILFAGIASAQTPAQGPICFQLLGSNIQFMPCTLTPGPPGPQGLQGPQGLPGPQGIPGVGITGVPLASLPVGTLAVGPLSNGTYLPVTIVGTIPPAAPAVAQLVPYAAPDGTTVNLPTWVYALNDDTTYSLQLAPMSVNVGQK